MLTFGLYRQVSNQVTMEKWNVTKSAELYGIENWGGGFFGVNPDGHVTVTPNNKEPAQRLDLYELVKSLRGRGIELPILVRFDGIIRSRVQQVQDAFRAAIESFDYRGHYSLAYPVKVNQQRHVVDAVRAAGRIGGIGLEVGSKPELLAVLAIHDQPNGLLLCNGYKDSDYIELALLARKLGRRSIIIVEQLYEVDTILRKAAKLGLDAEIGIRMKPANRGSGRWSESGGENAKFGLHSYEIAQAVEILKNSGKLSWLKLLHFHVGSQITSINAIKRALTEAGRMFVELSRVTSSMCLLDVGGGLAVDYDGSRTNFQSSMNYTTEEYARDVVWQIQNICDQENIPHPDIISESGRAVVAHHSLLVTEVMDAASMLNAPGEPELPPTKQKTLKEIYNLLHEVSIKSWQENLHDALSLREEVVLRFMQGGLTLSERAYADRTLKYILMKIRAVASELKNIPEDLERLDESLRDTYFCNFSLFQSLPDSWAIEQLFPVMPIHRLQEEPVRRAMLADVTCDSDGKIDHFIDQKDVKKQVNLHPYLEAEPYYLGIFLTGAYQEILGDLHNLFGDTNAVHIGFNEKGESEIVSLIEGDTVREVLSYVQFDAPDLLIRLRTSVERALHDGSLTPEDSAKLQKRFKEALEGYTYLLRD